MRPYIKQRIRCLPQGRVAGGSGTNTRQENWLLVPGLSGDFTKSLSFVLRIKIVADIFEYLL